VLLIDCVCSGGEIEFNNSHDVTIRGGRYESIRQEESCGDVRILDCRVGPAPVNGITSNPASPCERTTVRGVRIEGVANMPLALGGRENVIEDTEVWRGGAPSYLAGNGLRVRGLRSDGQVYLQTGVGQSLAQVRAAGLALGWADPSWPASQGVAVDCGGPVILGGKWQVWP
jgi:hypothetical protein